MRIALILLLVGLGVHGADAQTVAEIQAKYGKAVDVYSVSEHIWMTPEYAADGQVCRMRLYQKRIDSKTNFGSTKLPFDELRDVLNELAPLEMRGPKKELFGYSDLGGGTVWTTYEYENVRFTFVSFVRIDFEALKRAPPVVLDDLPYTPEPPKNLFPTKDDFANSASSATEFVTITWAARKCTKP
ncbi:MAG TPA: hypothetical protein VJS13_03400 [Pyrinomonadaceae bacterium]|nr:hypothetical protein [Pyrinomonadaceae bacterium]